MEKRIPQTLLDENLEQLELPALLEKLKAHITTPYGYKSYHELELLYRETEVRKKLDEVSEMVGLMDSGYSIPLEQTEDIRPLLERLKPEDSFLEAADLLQVKNNLQTLDELSRFLRSHRESAPGLAEYAGRIHSHSNIIKEIDRTIDEHGEVRENASPELRRIRIETGRMENELKTLFGRLLKRYTEFSQDDIMTLRDGRMVLGIQQHYVSKVQGIVHGTSGTGATVFIEPMETLTLSNRIQNLKIEERREIIRILKFISGLVREVRHDIFFAIEHYGLLDFIYAKAKFARRLGAAAPQLTAEKPQLRLMDARHPLLLLKMGPQNVVPLSLELGRSYHTLVITGPNAGGKTVTLKTIGLMILMTQLGLHIPANPDSIIPLLDLVLVDIGDRQSLEQDLSTFSAHILRLREILRQAQTHSLILVDEIGTGTDPREGSALAIAILQELTERKSLTVATTHHGELKAFAYHHEGVENASMEFDLETLQPTYRLQVGIPGSSYAFEIARRYGLPSAILKQAEDIVGPDKGQLEELILSLTERYQAVEQEHRQLSIRRSEAEGFRNMYEKEMERLKRDKKELRRQAADEADRILEKANAEVERLVREIRRTQAEKDTIRQAHQQIDRLREETGKVLQETSPKTESAPELHAGDVVWIEHLNQEGELLSDPNSNNRAWVIVGDIRMKLDTTGMKKVKKKTASSRQVFRSGRPVDDGFSSGIQPELDLRGMDADQAMQAVDNYLNQAMEDVWDEVRIIHGKGTGVLRRVVNDFLARDPRVEEKRLGKWGEGDTGVTVVKLKKEEHHHG